MQKLIVCCSKSEFFRLKSGLCGVQQPRGKGAGDVRGEKDRERCVGIGLPALLIVQLLSPRSRSLGNASVMSQEQTRISKTDSVLIPA